MSAITAERLKKFNEIQGTVAGTALDEMAAAELIAKENERNEQLNTQEDEENKDAVALLK